MHTALIIEDDRAYRLMMMMALEKEGYHTESAENGVAGVRLAKACRPDIIITDIMMDEMDGFGVLESVRSDPDLMTTPVIMTTGWASQDGMRQGMAQGADDYIPKPFRSQELINSVRTQIGKRNKVLQLAENRLESIRSSISTTIPHELRTPITIILGFTELLGADDANYSKEEIADIASHIDGAVTRLVRISENISLLSDLEFLSLDENRCSINRTVILNAEECVRQTSLAVARQFERTPDLELELINGVVNMPEKYYKKIVAELVDNALKFSRATSTVRVSLSYKSNRVVLAVSDSGVGLTEDQQRAIGPYVQFRRDFYEQSGIGIGLALVRRIVEIHAGTLEIDSTPGKGTTVEVSLPGNMDPDEQLSLL